MRDYRIAGLTVRMRCDGRTARQAEPYLSAFTGEPDIVIDVPETAVERERQAHPELCADDWRYLLTGSRFAQGILRHEGFVLHASAVVVDGRAYLFSAPSGGGKTTHTALWLRLFPGAYILNDDKPALRWEDGRWYVWGTPWSGTTDLNRNERVPLGGICFVEKGTEDHIVLGSDGDVAVRLYEQASRSRLEEGMDRLLSLMDRVMRDCPPYLLTCTPTERAARLAYDTLTKAQDLK